jgi:hypothetical protein
VDLAEIEVVTEAAEATVATEMAVHVVDMPVVETVEEAMTVVHVVAIVALVAHADVQKVAEDVEISRVQYFKLMKNALEIRRRFFYY